MWQAVAGSGGRTEEARMRPTTPERKPLGRRDIHLDFHTSGSIPGIGADFDGGEFAGRLREAHVDSVCVFARCHHGYCYYPTQVGTPHPHLEVPDLLGEMTRALRSADISVGVYTTVVWDELSWSMHPEWRVVDANGVFPRQEPVCRAIRRRRWGGGSSTPGILLSRVASVQPSGDNRAAAGRAISGPSAALHPGAPRPHRHSRGHHPSP